MDDATHAYICSRKACGCPNGFCVDFGDRDTARTVARWIRDGYTVDRLTIEESRGFVWGCRCAEQEAARVEAGQGRLFGG